MQPSQVVAGIKPGNNPDIDERLFLVNHTPYVVKYLKKHVASSKSVLELLCKDTGYRCDPKMQLVVFDRGGRVKTVGEMLESEYDIRRDTCKCTECGESIQIDTCLAHLQEGYQSGHKVGIKKVIEFLKTVAY